MKYSKAIGTSFLLLSGIGHTIASLPNMDVVLRGGDVVQEMDEGDFPKYRDGKCTIRWSRNGNWATQNGFNTGGWDANQRSSCGGAGPGADVMQYRLQSDGNFVAYCGYYLDYSTHTGQGLGDGNYFMAIDDQCVLHLYQGTFDCNSITIEKEIWTNIHLEPLQNGDRLGQGEIVRDMTTTGNQLIMQSGDGNLVLYGPSSASATDVVLWAANTEWGGPPSPDFF